MNEYDATELAFKNGYEKGKQEVAREIFAEIAEIADQLMNTPYYSIGDAIHDIAELNKKYTEESKQ
jgi:hypothetical protein